MEVRREKWRVKLAVGEGREVVWILEDSRDEEEVFGERIDYRPEHISQDRHFTHSMGISLKQCPRKMRGRKRLAY